MPKKLYWSSSRLEKALQAVRTPSGVQGSDWELFKGAIFGRDSLMVALDLLPTHPRLVHTIICTLARLQGEKFDLMTGEEPGRIHHEYRASVMDGTPVGPKQQEILNSLHRQWKIGEVKNGKVVELIIYATVDATPQYVRLMAAYCKLYGASILETEVTSRYGTKKTIQQSLEAALQWIEHRIALSDINLLEFRRTNPHAHEWEVMRDGRTSYMHENGTLANSESLVASIEVQGLAYDALIQGADLLDVREETDWLKMAKALRGSVLEHFYMPKENYFAMAIDRDYSLSPRKVKTLTSAPAELLDTSFFDKLPPPYKKKTMIEGIVRQIYSKQFLTPVGIRSRALKYAHLVNYSDYQGSLVSWVVMTNIFARGLRRQKLYELAEDMERRFMYGLNRSQQMAEFFYVDKQGRANYDNNKTVNSPHGAVVIAGSNIPEYIQAWTISAAMRVANEKPRKSNSISPWKNKLTKYCLDIAAKYKEETAETRFFIDVAEGRRREKAFIETLGIKDLH